ncbi:hypothetical protein V6N13_073906 [Hibiscus sabdariffa]
MTVQHIGECRNKLGECFLCGSLERFKSDCTLVHGANQALTLSQISAQVLSRGSSQSRNVASGIASKASNNGGLRKIQEEATDERKWGLERSQSVGKKIRGQIEDGLNGGTQATSLDPCKYQPSKKSSYLPNHYDYAERIMRRR